MFEGLTGLVTLGLLGGGAAGPGVGGTRRTHVNVGMTVLTTLYLGFPRASTGRCGSVPAKLSHPEPVSGTPEPGNAPASEALDVAGYLLSMCDGFEDASQEKTGASTHNESLACESATSGANASTTQTNIQLPAEGLEELSLYRAEHVQAVTHLRAALDSIVPLEADLEAMLDGGMSAEPLLNGSRAGDLLSCPLTPPVSARRVSFQDGGFPGMLDGHNEDDSFRSFREPINHRTPRQNRKRPLARNLTGEKLEVHAASPRRRLWLPVSSAPARSVHREASTEPTTSNADAQARALQCCLDVLLLRHWLRTDLEEHRPWSCLNIQGVAFPSDAKKAVKAEGALRAKLRQLLGHLSPLSVQQLSESLCREWQELSSARRRSWTRRNRNRSDMRRGILKSPKAPKQRLTSYELRETFPTMGYLAPMAAADASVPSHESLLLCNAQPTMSRTAQEPASPRVASLRMEEAASIIAALPAMMENGSSAAGVEEGVVLNCPSERGEGNGSHATTGACVMATCPPMPGSDALVLQDEQQPFSSVPRQLGVVHHSPSPSSALRGELQSPIRLRGSARIPTPLRSRGAWLLSRSAPPVKPELYPIIVVQGEDEASPENRRLAESKRKIHPVSPLWAPHAASRRGRQLLHHAAQGTKQPRH